MTYDELSRLPAYAISQRLGLPAEQGIRGAQLGFDVYAISPKPGVIPTVFVSEVAPIKQGGYFAKGGALQTLVPNRELWTSPKKIGTIPGDK